MAADSLTPEALARRLPAAATTGRYIVALSGGLDSSVLLSLVVALRDSSPEFPAVCALHVHHGISSNADHWVRHCEESCAGLSVPLAVRKASVATTAASVENNLRDARYRCFEDYLQENDVLLQAHHRDDQIETLLLRLFRGAGARGGSGIPEQRGLGAGRLYRPLLDYSRDHLHAYAREQQLAWVEDESNQDTRFDRNFLRSQVLPLVRQRWPGIEKTLPRFASINDQSRQALDYLLAPVLDRIQDPDSGLRLAELAEYPEPVQVNLLRLWLQRLQFEPVEYHQYYRVLQEVVAARQDAQPLLVAGDVEFRRHAGSLIAQRKLAPHDITREWPWEPDIPLTVNGVGTLTAVPVLAQEATPALRMPAAGQQLSVSFRRGGERCRPAGRSASHPLKKLLQEYAVPPWLRDRVPLIYLDGELIAVADLWVCEGAGAIPGDPGLVLQWQRP